MDGDVGVTIATHGWIGTEMTGGRVMLEEGAEMQWKEEREVSLPIPRKIVLLAQDCGLVLTE